MSTRLAASFAGRAPVLYHCNGDFCSEEGYTPQETPLQPAVELSFAPNGGRPCDGAFPYYRVQFEDCGLTLGHRLARAMGGHLHGPSRGRPGSGRSTAPSPSSAAGRMYPHAQDHASVLDRGQHPGDEPMAPLVSRPPPAPTGGEADRAASGRRGDRPWRGIHRGDRRESTALSRPICPGRPRSRCLVD